MSFWDFTRSPASVRLLVDFGEERGLAAPNLLTGTGLAREQLEDPHVEVNAAQELRVVSNLLRLLKHPAGLGLQVGARYHFSAYGLWGYGLIASATAGDALSLALRFLPLTYAFTSISYHEEGDLGVLIFGEPDLPDTMKHFVVQRDMTAAAVLLNEVGRDRFPLARLTTRAQWPLPADRSSSVIQSVFGIEPEFSASLNSLAFERSHLSQPLPQADPVTVSMCEQMCSRLIEERRVRLGTAKMIQHYLNAIPGSMPSTLEDMARLMNTSQRTLKRRLQEEGTTFRVLLAQSRGTMAEELLRDGRLSLSEIAERLGFSDLSSFSQAFKRWYGEAPSTFRREREHPVQSR
ncbi:AraC family transcriptional regulator [Paraburkholderia elongata]|uniref:Helix-turn-helix domain-containing protein n=1 Tax=Paraburkholderia elongata TaxID=2675747 RepID=A0A972SIE8_9BURK|nr:AraC family transcriptional regulator [Paraburkholderia elongata]NPT56009.1 helix-turn-helix domain-containing protein [Paraburkholderia elongata]